jgi:AAA+ ATPase superfamily predicted ATPase
MAIKTLPSPPLSEAPFIGRSNELHNLELLLEKKVPSLVVIKGRRRIGKSRLVEEFSKGKSFYTFSGLPPTSKTTAQHQRDEFCRQMGEQLHLPGIIADDWGDIFNLFAKNILTGRKIILFDEISWMGSKDPTFLGKLKTAWDTHFKKNPKLIFILCGSISSWIEENLISSTGFMGRITLQISLDELGFKESIELLEKIGFRGSIQEKLILLSVTGGVPRYIELINPNLSATENIRKLCFEPNGILTQEFDHIFHDLFGRRSKIYREFANFLASKPAEYQEISKAIHYSSSGPMSHYLSDLVMSGYLSHDLSWNIKLGKEGRISRYRLRDNYIRFYLKYISPHLKKIERGSFKNTSITSLPGWESITGLQFENLILNNRSIIHEMLKIHPEEIINDNPYYQKKTSKHPGCQIDYLIQAKYNRLYVCEIKFSKNPIPASVIHEVKAKIQSLAVPRGFSCIPILISSNGVTEDLREKEFFAKIIDFSALPFVAN